MQQSETSFYSFKDEKRIILSKGMEFHQISFTEDATTFPFEFLFLYPTVLIFRKFQEVKLSLNELKNLAQCNEIQLS